MPVSVSDKEDNRRVVTASLRTPDGSYKDDRSVQAGYDAADETVRLSESVLTRREMIPYVLENRYELAIWKSTADSDRWIEFTTQLQLNGATVRDINTVKQIIDQEFKKLLGDALADGYRDVLVADKIKILTGVRSVTSYNGGNGLTVKIELL